MKSKTFGLFKIGMSVDPWTRVAEVSPASANVVLLHTISTHDPRWLESLMHRAYSPAYRGGEWFDLNPAHVRQIRGVKSANEEADLPASWLMSSVTAHVRQPAPAGIQRNSAFVRLTPRADAMLRAIVAITRRTMATELEIALENHAKNLGV